MGQIGSLGGAISRFSLEQSLQSAFHSMPPFFPGPEFKHVQNFIATQVFEIAEANELAAASELVENPSSAEVGAGPGGDSLSTSALPSDKKETQAGRSAA